MRVSFFCFVVSVCFSLNVYAEATGGIVLRPSQKIQKPKLCICYCVHHDEEGNQVNITDPFIRILTPGGVGDPIGTSLFQGGNSCKALNSENPTHVPQCQPFLQVGIPVQLRCLNPQVGPVY
ncbi:MAG: hypothetical protein AB7F66_13450 [Bacteriovoracia bacterium]